MGRKVLAYVPPDESIADPSRGIIGACGRRFANDNPGALLFGNAFDPEKVPGKGGSSWGDSASMVVRSTPDRVAALLLAADLIGRLVDEAFAAGEAKGRRFVHGLADGTLSLAAVDAVEGRKP